jgi:hypothetical protein
MVLELMGYLVSFYRSSAFGLKDEAGPCAASTRKGEGLGDG